jgi:exodeoxyribonuclease X
MTIARVIDYETTGTQDNDAAEIVEMGAVDVNVDGAFLVPASDWQSFCVPRGPIPPETKAVHHITEADVAGAPQARELWGEFIESDPPQYLVAHNAKFEQHFTPDFGIPWICTYKVARVVWPDAPGHSNQCLRYWLGLDLETDRASPPHRALPDAYVTAHLFCRLLAEKTPDEMVAISKYPALLKVMNFGKHKGTTFQDAPADYLEWIRDKSDMDEDTKFTARYWLRKRAP